VRRILIENEDEFDNFETFQDFKGDFNRKYGHDSEFQKFDTFKGNLEYIENF